MFHPNDPISQKVVRNFEEFHKGHTLITIDLNEVRGKYDCYIPIVIDLSDGERKYKYKKIQKSQFQDSKNNDIQEPNNSEMSDSRDVEA